MRVRARLRKWKKTSIGTNHADLEKAKSLANPKATMSQSTVSSCKNMTIMRISIDAFMIFPI